LKLQLGKQEVHELIRLLQSDLEVLA
jgi:hypothetical protein